MKEGVMNMKMIQQGPSWSVAVLVQGPEGKTIAQGISSSADDQLRKLPKGESITEDGSSPRNTAARILRDGIGLDVPLSSIELKGRCISSQEHEPRILFMFVAKVTNTDGLLSEVQKKKRAKAGYKLLDFKSIMSIPGFFQNNKSEVKIVYPRSLIIRKS